MRFGVVRWPSGQASGRGRGGWVGFLRAAWRFGGWTERAFVVLVGAAPFAAAVDLVVLVGYSFLNHAQGPQYVVGVIAQSLASVAWFFYSFAVMRPLNSVRVIRGLLEMDRLGLSPEERAYLAEVLRYKEAAGVDGQIQGDVAYGIAYAMVYYASGAATVAVSLGLYPFFGQVAPALFAAADFFLGILCMDLFFRRDERKLKAAEAAGFRLRATNPWLKSPEVVRLLRR